MMRIISIELYHVSAPLPETFWPSWISGYPETHNRFTLAKLVTDVGIEGYATGETGVIREKGIQSALVIGKHKEVRTSRDRRR